MTKILILGVTGMLGNAAFRFLSKEPNFRVYGTARGSRDSFLTNFSEDLLEKIVPRMDIENYDSLIKMFSEIKPEIVINCIGLIKQLADANDPLQTLPLNSIFPHRLARLCKAFEARLIHISTDCVFSGSKGNYKETDLPDCNDLYGRSKLLGEVDYTNAITLRTSIIGHELAGHKSLINWFLAQNNKIQGFTKAIYTGFPTVELIEIIRKHVIPNPHMRGLYHVASQPISKYELLKLVSDVYSKRIEIEPVQDPVIDRSLNGERFNNETGYIAPNWPTLVQKMYEFK